MSAIAANPVAAPVIVATDLVKDYRMGAETVHALINISFFTTAVPSGEIAEKILKPLRATTAMIEHAIVMTKAGPAGADQPMAIEPAF